MVSIEIRDSNGESVKASQEAGKLTDEQRAALADATSAVLRFAGIVLPTGAEGGSDG